MLLQPLNEMAAKKICPQCGLSMAKNHYWYKGGWRCKKSNMEVATNIRNADAEKLAAAKPQAPAQPAPAPAERERPTSIEQVRVGDWVCFKYDIEQCGEVVKITRDWQGRRMFSVVARDGEYVDDHHDGNIIQIPARDCWIE